MREIKFRAWDESMGKMEFFGLGDTVPYYYPDEWSSRINYEVMQFTGLLDKNGKEIYEGDIIESVEDNYIYKINPIVPLSRSCVDRSETIGRRCDNEIIHSNGISENYNDDWISNSEFYEIIGNIYENPELLK